MGKRFEAVEKELKTQKEETARLKLETAGLKLETAGLKELLAKQIQASTRYHLVNFKNQVSQFGKGLEAAVVFLKFPNAIKLFGERNLTFNKVFRSESIKDMEKNDFREFPPYVKLNEITGKQSIFQDVVSSRNKDSHPDKIDVYEIEDTLEAISTCECLRPAEKEIFEKSKYAFEQLKKLPELSELIEEFNNQKFNK